MLAEIISRYLNISLEQSKAVLELLALEGQGKKPVLWKEREYDLTQAKTQADFLSFLQAVGQVVWFQGFDRSKYPDIGDEELNNTYYALIERMGLTQTVHLPADCQPDFAAVLGSSETNVSFRTESLKSDLLKGHVPKRLTIFGTGCNRQLGVSVPFSEDASKERLLALKRDPVEMEMLTLLTTDMLEGDKTFHTLRYEPVNTTANVQSREDPNCVKTFDTATSMRQAIERRSDFHTMKKPILVAVYSNQPYVKRQEQDAQKSLGDQFLAIGVGREFTKADFLRNPKSINVVRGELARLINTPFTPQYLETFQIPLSLEELREIATLTSPMRRSPSFDQFRMMSMPQTQKAEQTTTDKAEESSQLTKK